MNEWFDVIVKPFHHESGFNELFAITIGFAKTFFLYFKLTNLLCNKFVEGFEKISW